MSRRWVFGIVVSAVWLVLAACGEVQTVEVTRTVTVPVEVIKTVTVEVPVDRIVTKEVVVEKIVTQIVHQSDRFPEEAVLLSEYVPEVAGDTRVRRGRGPEVVDILLPEGEEFTVELSLVYESSEVILSLTSGTHGITIARWPTINFTSAGSGSNTSISIGAGGTTRTTSRLGGTYVGDTDFAIHGASGTVNVLLVTRSNWMLTFTRTK